MKKLLLTVSILSCSLFANNIPTLKDLDLQKITKQEQFTEKDSKFLELLLLRIDSQELAKSVMVTFPDKKEKELEEAYYSFLEGFSHSYKANMIMTNCSNKKAIEELELAEKSGFKGMKVMVTDTNNIIYNSFTINKEICTKK